MKDVLRTNIPNFERVLLIESGSRELIQSLIPILYQAHGDNTLVDVVTCYSGDPAGLKPGSTVFHISSYQDGSAGRRRLLQELRSRAYNVQGIICSGEAVLARWKWFLSLQIPAKTFILNENGDYFWIDRAHADLIRHFILFRAGLVGAAAVPTLLRLVAFPFTALYLLWFATSRNVMRRLRVP